MQEQVKDVKSSGKLEEEKKKEEEEEKRSRRRWGEKRPFSQKAIPE